MAENLRKKTSKGLLWNTVHNLAMKGIQFLLMLFMARLLSPDDYGTVGLMAVFIMLSSVFIDSGLGTALVRKKDRTQTDLSTVFYFNLVVGAVCYVAVYLFAPYVAVFYEKPELTLLLRVLALTIVLGSFNVILVTVLNYTMNFKKQAMISITHTFTSGVAGLIMALCGCGVWALVGQSLVQSVVGVALYWTRCDWRPSWVFSKDSFREMFGFSSKLLLTRLIDTVYDNIYPIIIGKGFSPSALGHYSRAQHWASFPSTNLVGIIQNVTFASLSNIQDQNDRLRNIYRKMIKTSAFVVFPLMMGLSAVAQPLIYFTIGEKWDFCVQILQIICFSFMLTPILSLNNSLIQVKGRSDLTLRLGIIEKVIAVAVLFVSVPLGLLAMCWFGVGTSLCMYLLNSFYVGRLLGLGTIRQLHDLLPSFVMAAVMMLVVHCSMLVTDNSLLQLLIGVLSGAASYTALAAIFQRSQLAELKQVITGMLSR